MSARQATSAQRPSPAAEEAPLARLRVCLLADASSIHVQRWAASLATRGHQVDVVTLTPSSFDDRVDVHAVAAITGGQAWSRRLPKARGLEAKLRTAYRVRRRVQALRSDLVHAHFLGSYGQWAYLAGLNYVLSLWGSDVFALPERGWTRRLSQRALRRARFVLCDSADLRAAAIRLGASDASTACIGFGVDTRRFRPDLDDTVLRQRLGLPSDALVVLSPRILDTNYNILAIVRAFAALTSDERFVLVLKHYRGSETYRRDVQREIDRLDLGDRVRWVGEVDHGALASFYAGADVVISMADPDSAPVSVLEALACGAVVVATDVPSLREWIEPGVNGFLARPEEPHEIAAALVTAAHLPKPVRREWATANYELIRSRADETVEITRAEKIYLAAAARHAGRR